MKQLKLSIREFLNFQAIAKFIYTYSVSKSMIIIEADAKMLEALGY